MINFGWNIIGREKGIGVASHRGSLSEPIDLNDGLDLSVGSNERPIRTQTTKKKPKAKVKTDEAFSFDDALGRIKERRQISIKQHEQEKRERFERQVRAKE